MLVYAKFSNTRRRKYRLNTTLEEKAGSLVVNKSPHSSEAAPFLYSLLDKYEVIKNANLPFEAVKPYRSGLDRICFEFSRAPSFQAKLLAAVKAGNRAEFLSLINRYKDLINAMPGGKYQPSPEFCRIFGESLKAESDCVETGCFDLNFDNIFIDGGSALLIDFEWTFGFPIPRNFILFRAILSFYMNFNSFRPNSVMPLAELLAHVEIPQSEHDQYLLCEENFQFYVTGRTPQDISKLREEIARISSDPQFFSWNDERARIREYNLILETEAAKKNEWILKIEQGIREKDKWIEKLEKDNTSIASAFVEVNSNIGQHSAFFNLKPDERVVSSEELEKMKGYIGALENLCKLNGELIKSLQSELRVKIDDSRSLEKRALKLSSDLRLMSLQIDSMRAKLGPDEPSKD